jgi:ferredoxin-type protein NapF
MSSEVDHSRRGFLRGKVRTARAPLRPPWALAEAEFLTRCTRCRNCAVICPTKIIELRNGMPEVNFTAAGCTFCGECARVCMPVALRKDDGKRPWHLLARIGDACIAGQGVECRICGEHCDETAIRFPPRVGAPPAPEVDAGRCTGCGACVAPCPALAIVVR